MLNDAERCGSGGAEERSDEGTGQPRWPALPWNAGFGGATRRPRAKCHARRVRVHERPCWSREDPTAVTSREQKAQAPGRTDHEPISLRKAWRDLSLRACACDLGQRALRRRDSGTLNEVVTAAVAKAFEKGPQATLNTITFPVTPNVPVQRPA